MGIDLATPVVETIESEARSKFIGKIPKVTVAVKEAPKEPTHQHGHHHTGAMHD